LVLKAGELSGRTGGMDIGPIFLGTVIAAVVGYFGLKGLIRLTISGKLYLFSFYLWALGLVVLWTSLT
jgi:undecaprenyl-diphosphatase